LEEILTYIFSGIKVGLKLFFSCLLGVVMGPLSKYGTNTLQLLLGVFLNGRCLHITVAVGGSLKA